MSEIFWRHPRTTNRRIDPKRKLDLRGSKGRLKKRWYDTSDIYEDMTSENLDMGACLTDRELEAFDKVEW
jgi:hypothetical protein